MTRALCLMLVVAANVAAEDVPQFRGVGGRGVSSETGLPVKWSATENVRWKADLVGRGLSGPIVTHGLVFVTSASGPEQKRLHVHAFDLKTGKKAWERQFWATGSTQCHNKTNMAAPTPVTDGKKVYALFATGDLACLDLEGNLEWVRSLVGDYPTIGNGLGMASSPILHEDVLLVHMENSGESFAVAVDTTTGINRWRIPRPNTVNWNTPHLLREDGQTRLLLATPNALSAHDLATGREVWTYTKSKLASQPSMTSVGDIIYIPSEGLTALKPQGEGKEPEVLWTAKKLQSGPSSPTVADGLAFAVSKSIINCADAKTGEHLWTHRAQGGGVSGSALVAEGRFYLTAEDGVTTVLEVGRKAKVLSVNELPDQFMSGPVASGGAILLRSDKHLYCLANP